MSHAFDCQQNDTVEFTVTLTDADDAVADVSAATVRSMLIQNPSGATTAAAMDWASDGTDGKLVVVVPTETFDTDGTWRYQYKIETPAGQWSTAIQTLKVGPVLAVTP